MREYTFTIDGRQHVLTGKRHPASKLIWLSRTGEPADRYLLGELSPGSAQYGPGDEVCIDGNPVYITLLASAPVV